MSMLCTVSFSQLCIHVLCACMNECYWLYIYKLNVHVCSLIGDVY